VDGAALADGQVETFKRYLILPLHAAEAMTLWTLATFALELFEYFPFLVFSSPTPRAGKSRALNLLRCVVSRPKKSARMSPAALARLAAEGSPTFLLDEADATLVGNEERVEALRGILDAAFERGNTVDLCAKAGKDWTVKQLPVFCPIALATIDRLLDTIRDRSIVVHMKRRTDDEKVERFRRLQRKALEVLPRQFIRWFRDNAKRLAEIYEAGPAIPDMLDDRAADFWEPLLTIAEVLGGPWPERARAAAVALSGSRDSRGDEDNLRIALISDIKSIFEDKAVERIRASDLATDLADLDGRPWGEWGKRGGGITSNAVGRLLKSFGIEPRKAHGIMTYERSSFEDTWGRYLSTPLSNLPPSPGYGLSAPEGHLGPDRKPPPNPAGGDSLIAAKPAPNLDKTAPGEEGSFAGKGNGQAENFLHHEKHCGLRNQVPLLDGRYGCGRCGALLDIPAENLP
jgi:putative DNA primase/helicase